MKTFNRFTQTQARILSALILMVLIMVTKIQVVTKETQIEGEMTVLRQKAIELTLYAMEKTAIHDTAQFERLLANADAFNTAAVWLASLSSHEGTQA